MSIKASMYNNYLLRVTARPPTASPHSASPWLLWTPSLDQSEASLQAGQPIGGLDTAAVSSRTQSTATGDHSPSPCVDHKDCLL